MRRIFTRLFVVAVSVGAAPAGPGPQAILERMDEAMNRAEDQFLEYEMVDTNAGRVRTLSLEVSLKGEKRLTAFTSPADLRGTKVLIVSPTQMYVYLPAYKKIRRIASHVTEQGFMGTTYSNDDLALVRYADKYDASLASETEEAWVLKLAARKEAEAPYAAIRLTVEKARHLPLRIEYFDGEGRKLKTEVRRAYTCEAGVCAPSELSMTDHTDGDHVSTLKRKQWKVNSGLPDRLFTKRSLARAR